MVRQLLTLAFALMNSFYSFSQSYGIEEIKHKGNTYLQAYFSDTTILIYCHPFEEVLIGYKLGKRKDTINEWTGSGGSTRGKFIAAKVSWLFKIPYSKCPVYDTIKGIVSIELDQSLVQISAPDLNFIPQSYYFKDSCDFITEAEARAITKKQNFKLGTDSLKMQLIYEKSLKMYIWNISQIRCREIDEFGRCWGDIETLHLSAKSGEVLFYELTNFGHP